jgi:glycosyltransferase involved in cell wall biosynthesis
MTAEPTWSVQHRPDRPAAAGQPARRLRILHLVLVLGETNSQYNEHCLPQLEARDLTICTYFPPKLTPPPGIALFPGDGTLVGFFRALRSALAEREYDVLHAHSPHTAVLLPVALASRPRLWRLWRSMLLTVHTSFAVDKPRNQAFTLVGLALFPRVVFCSRSSFESFPLAARTLVGRRARVVQNGADLERVTRAVANAPAGRDGAFSVVSVGRLERGKDPREMVAAFDAVAEPGCRLLLVGGGSLEQDVRRELEARGLEDRVEMPGLVARQDVFGYYARGDLFVSVSHGEGLPVAVIEAMASGLPAVLSDIPPHREVVDGLDVVPLVPPGDLDGFAREIERFRRMPADQRREIGQLCKRWVLERFGLDRMHGGYERVYREYLPAEETP